MRRHKRLCPAKNLLDNGQQTLLYDSILAWLTALLWQQQTFFHVSRNSIDNLPKTSSRKTFSRTSPSTLLCKWLPHLVPSVRVPKMAISAVPAAWQHPTAAPPAKKPTGQPTKRPAQRWQSTIATSSAPRPTPARQTRAPKPQSLAWSSRSIFSTTATSSPRWKNWSPA